MSVAELNATGPDLSAVERKLAGAWRRERWVAHARGLGHLTLWAVGLFLFDLLVDWLFDLSGPARVLLLVVNAAVLGSVVRRLWWRHLRRYDAARVALQVERLHPGLKSLLVSCVQLARAGAHGSPRLIRVVLAQAAEAARPLDFRGVVDFRTLRKLFTVAGSVLALFLLSGLFAGEFYRVLLVRLLDQASALAYPTRTTIEDVTGDLVVKEGDAVTLSARAGGEVPDDGMLLVRFGDGAWERLGVGRGEGDRFRHQFQRGSRSFDYRFRLGDVRSPVYRVTVIPPPRLRGVKASLRFPAYVGRAAEAQDGLNLPPLPAGTGLRLWLRCDQELAPATLRPLREGAAPLPLEVDKEDRRIVHLTLPDVVRLADESPVIKGREEAQTVTYQFDWTERTHGFTFRDATRYTLEVVPDRVPVVTLVEPRPLPPQERMPATVRKVLSLTFEARDDHALSRAWVVYRLNDGPETRRPVGSFPPGTKGDTFRAAPWPLRETLDGLKEGDLLSCAVEVSDNREGRGGPNLGRSPSLRLRIVSEEEYRRHVEKEKERGFDRTRAAAREEAEGSRKVKALIPAGEERP